MSGWRRFFSGSFIAVLSSVLLLGSILLSYAENGYAIAIPSTMTQTITAVPGFVFESGVQNTENPAGIATQSLMVASATNIPIVKPTKTPGRCPGAPSGWVTYFVQRGDTLFTLALVTRVEVAQIKTASCIEKDDLQIGQKLRLPFFPYTAPRNTALFPPTVTPSATRLVPPTETPFIPPGWTPVPGATNTQNAPVMVPSATSNPISTSISIPTVSELPVFQPPTSTPLPPPATDTAAPLPKNTALPPPANTPIQLPSDTSVPLPSETPASLPLDTTPNLPDASGDFAPLL